MVPSGFISGAASKAATSSSRSPQLMDVERSRSEAMSISTKTSRWLGLAPSLTRFFSGPFGLPRLPFFFLRGFISHLSGRPSKSESRLGTAFETAGTAANQSAKTITGSRKRVFMT